MRRLIEGDCQRVENNVRDVAKWFKNTERVNNGAAESVEDTFGNWISGMLSCWTSKRLWSGSWNATIDETLHVYEAGTEGRLYYAVVAIIQ